MQSHGTLAETPLRSLLESAQGERSTGTLTVRNGNGQSTSLYFLFGHLFHAQGDGKSGDDVVVNAPHWTKGDFEFDAKAKLPADETVKAGIPELVNTVVAEPQHAPAPAEPKPEPCVRRRPASRINLKPTAIVASAGSASSVRWSSAASPSLLRAPVDGGAGRARSSCSSSWGPGRSSA